MSMKTQIKGRNVTVTDALQDYANEKIEHVHKLLQQRKIDEVTRVELELRVEKNPSIPEPCIAEATVFTRGPVIRACEASTDMYAAIDLVTDKLTRRVKKYHDKMHGKTRHGHDKPVVDVEPRPLWPTSSPARARTTATTVASSRPSSSRSSRCRSMRPRCSWSW
jgi:putative sigma-54 modulation protein